MHQVRTSSEKLVKLAKMVQIITTFVPVIQSNHHVHLEVSEYLSLVLQLLLTQLLLLGAQVGQQLLQLRLELAHLPRTKAISERSQNSK